MRRWYYTHDEAIQGPATADELHRLAHTGGLLPTDLIWPENMDAAEAVPAEAAMVFGLPLAEEPPAAGPAPASVRAPLPDWVRDSAAALGPPGNPGGLSTPPPSAWLRDVLPPKKPSGRKS
jgi:hypothetical protein